ncbi:hypothetical protein [Streptomyces spinosus]|uniref:hypothetical protein n=1 Tax=Streptomyces spinosus TaxID=2872623 RepID=UPI001CECEF3E|nr:hypothetical protein [Streptomyces spinosus]
MGAVDGLGNGYEDRGGASGTRPDGTRTDGSLSGHPAPHRDASSLRLHITWLRGGEETSYDTTLVVRD